jgi:D-alanyl-lipoteichoic acid acyltransferase DltB (MBOAT superfamily)
MKVRNTFIIFIVSGFWHGANWTYILWGLINACYFLPLLLMKMNRSNIDIVANNSIFPGVRELFLMVITFGITCIAWVFFRAEDVGQAFNILKEIFSTSLLSVPTVRPSVVIIFLFLFVIIEWFGRKDEFALERIRFAPFKIARWSIYLILVITVYYYSGKDVEFIYFQF